MASHSTRTYVELKVAATNLRGRRLDPFAVLMRPESSPTFSAATELARTEIVWSDSSPAFVQSFEIPFPVHDPASAAQIEYRLAVYSKASRSDELRKNSFLGYADFTLDRVLAKTDGIIERVLRSKAGKNDGKRGRLVICGEKVTVAESRHMFSIQFGFGFNSHAWGPDPGKKAKKAFYVRSVTSSLAGTTHCLLIFSLVR